MLTAPGLGGIVEAVREGRATFQRILAYTLNTLVKKIEAVLFLGVGLAVTGRAVLTPLLMVLLLVTNDVLTMSLTTDRPRLLSRPDAWRVGAITVLAAALGLVKLGFSTAVLAWGYYGLGLAIGPLRLLAFVTLVLGSQATVYVVRERRHLWSSRPSVWMVLCSAADVSIASGLAMSGLLAAPLPASVVAVLLGAAALFAFVLDAVKHLAIACGAGP